MIDFDLTGLSTGASGLLQSLELNFSADIDRVQDLSIYIASPDPDGITGSNSTADPDTILVADLCQVATLCPFANIDVAFRDFALLPHSALGDSILNCRSGSTYAHLGAFRPATAFGSLSGSELAYDSTPGDDADDNLAGTWTLIVCNKGATPIQNIVTSLGVTSQSEETILGFNDIIETTGCGNNISFSFSDEVMNSDCTAAFSSVITRTWTVTNDDSGFSNSCEQTINIARINLDDIIFPENHDGLAFPALSCQSFVNASTGLNTNLVSADTIPLPALTGFPRVAFGDICDNFRVEFEDTKIRVCGEFGMKVLREWTILDWCDSEIRRETQVIKVDQVSDIITTCPPFELVFATGSQCTGEAALPVPIVSPGPNSCASEILSLIHI